MRQVFFAVLTTFGLAVSAQAGSNAAAASTVDTTWTVSLDANGRVVDLAQSTKVKPVLSEPLAAAIRGWTFEPGRIDGQPAPTETTLYVTVTLELQTGDGYAVRVASASTGGALDKVAFPSLSSRALRSIGASPALAVVEAHYDESGKVLEAKLAPDTPKIQRELSRAALSAARRWIFRPERVDGHAIAASAYVPVCFSIGGVDCPTWTPPGAQAGIGDGAAFALQPAATLKSDVIGRML